MKLNNLLRLFLAPLHVSLIRYFLSTLFLKIQNTVDTLLLINKTEVTWFCYYVLLYYLPYESYDTSFLVEHNHSYF